MAQTKLNLGRLNIQQLLQSANNVKTAMTGNANFTAPIPPLPTIGTLITNLVNANNTYQSGVVTQSQNLTLRDNAEDALAAGLTSLAAYVQAQSGGDAAKIQSAGMDVKGAPAPAGMPGQVSNLALTFGDNAGELDAQWDSDPAAYSYEIQTSPDPMTATSWVAQPGVTKSSTALLGLTSGARQWVRVRSVGSAGTGAWSDPATKIVP
jgi:hypothetical protein